MCIYLFAFMKQDFLKWFDNKSKYLFWKCFDILFVDASLYMWACYPLFGARDHGYLVPILMEEESLMQSVDTEEGRPTFSNNLREDPLSVHRHLALWDCIVRLDLSRLTWVGIVACIALSIRVVSSLKPIFLEKNKVLYNGFHRIIESECFELMRVSIYLYDFVWVLIVENCLIKAQSTCIVYLFVKFIWDLTFMTMYFDLCHILPQANYSLCCFKKVQVCTLVYEPKCSFIRYQYNV